jgi:hypothetical protein
MFIIGVLNFVSIYLVRKSSIRSLAKASWISYLTVALHIWGTAWYVVAIILGRDYFDVLLFLPVVFALFAGVCVWRVKRAFHLQTFTTESRTA